MQRDLSGSVTATAIIIALLFWLMHRRWLPVLWLLALLALILVATIALGGLILGPICVVSMGFAAVLLGLAVDYAVVHYQEALAHPQLSVPEIRRAIAPSILWAAITTISAFLVLNFGGLPGLAQLGSLVAIGVALAALVMVMAYLPPLFPGRQNRAGSSAQTGVVDVSAAAESWIRRTGKFNGIARNARRVCRHNPGSDFYRRGVERPSAEVGSDRKRARAPNKPRRRRR